jgi:hypothetical protein
VVEVAPRGRRGCICLDEILATTQRWCWFDLWRPLPGQRCEHRAGCDEILTEDLNAGEIIAGVRIRNPFAV